MRALIAVAAALALAACSPDPTSAYPSVSSLYSIDGADVSCHGAGTVTIEPTSGPATRIDCEYTCVVLEGRNVRWVSLTFQRSDPSSAWTLGPWAFDFNGYESLCP